MNVLPLLTLELLIINSEFTLCFQFFSNTYEGTQYCGCTTKLTILSIFSTFPGYFELVQFPYKNVTWDFIAQLVGSRNSTIKVLRGTDIHYLSPQNIWKYKAEQMSEDATSNVTCVFFGSSFNEPYDIIVGRTNKMIMEWVEKWKAVVINKQM